MKFIGWICTFVVFDFLSSIYSGYVLSVMWDWFIVSHFGLKALPIPFAIGLALIISFTKKQDSEDKSDTNELGEILLKGIVKSLAKPSMFLFFGWIVTLFI